MSTRITDGATLRKTRILDMVRYIADSKGCTTQDIESWMLAVHGLKFETTVRMIQECHLAHLIVEDHGKWLISDKGTLTLYKT
jgi:hypothetical protein